MNKTRKPVGPPQSRSMFAGSRRYVVCMAVVLSAAVVASIWSSNWPGAELLMGQTDAVSSLSEALEPKANAAFESERNSADGVRHTARISLISGARRVLTVPQCQIMILDSADLGSQRSGILRSIDVREGDVIKAGQTLVTIEDELARASLKLHEREAGNDVELRYARKVSDVARTEYARALELNREIPNAHSELQINSLRMEAERALLQIEQAENRIELARLRLAEARVELATYRINSPIDGVVQRVRKSVGEAVHEGETLIEIASFSRLKVAADLPLDQALQLRRGMTVSVKLDEFPGDGNQSSGEALGKIVFVGRKVHEVSRTVQIWAEVDNSNRQLFAGLTGTMTILLDGP